MRVLEPRATEAAAAVDGSSNDSDTLSGRSLGILIAFIGLFILIVAFACSRRNAHIRALALTRERERETQRQRKRPLLSDVQLTAARGGGTSWKSIQPLAARVIAPATRPTRQRTNGPQPLLPPPPTAGTNLIDYNALIGDAWFSGVRNVNGPPTPPAPRPTAVRRREPAMHVAVLIAMPTPRPSAHAPGTSSFHHDISPSHGADSVNAHDHPPEADPGPGPPPNVALGTARMPWRQREQARIFNFDGLA